MRDQYFDLQGLSAYSAMSVSTLRDQIKSNGLPCYVLRGKILVKRSEFDAWMLEFRRSRSQDIDRIADEVIDEIGLYSRRSQKGNQWE